MAVVVTVVDVEVIVDSDDKDDRRAARDHLTGKTIGNLVLEAQDIEISTREELRGYFYTRDVSQNEVMVLKRRAGFAMLLFSEDAENDMKSATIRPALHCLHSDFCVMWRIDPVTHKAYCGAQNFERSLVRYLKGHGTNYAFDEATWTYYRRNKLSTMSLFKILKPFHDNDEKYNKAIDHLIEIGILSRTTVSKAGGSNRLWGELLHQVNSKIARFGQRFTLTEFDVDQVEAWVDRKKGQTSNTLLTSTVKARRTGYVQSGESVESLGLYTLSKSFEEYLVSGKVYDYKTSETVKPLEEQPLQSATGAASPREEWGLTLEVARSRRVSMGNESGRSLTKTESFHNKVQLVLQNTPKGEATLESAQAKAKIVQDLDAQNTQELAREVRRRQREANKNDCFEAEQILRKKPNSPIVASVPAPRPPPDRTTNSDMGSGQSGVVGPMQAMLPSTFFHAPADDPEVVPIADEDVRATAKKGRSLRESGAEEAKKKGRLMSNRRIFRFLLATMSTYPRYLTAAYICLLLSLAARLYIPIVGGYMFDAVSGDSESDFRSYLPQLALMMAAHAVLRVSGLLLMERFSLFSLRRFFYQLFSHLIHQDMAYFDCMSTGEVLARTGGDSLTFRSLLTTSIYRFFESVCLLAGAIAFIAVRSGQAISSSMPLLLAIIIIQVLNVVAGATFGPYARRKNLAVRQALGRLYGFTLDTFTHIRTLVSNQMERRQSRDYWSFAVDYFRRSYTLNCATVLLTSFTLIGSLFIRFFALYGGALLIFSEIEEADELALDAPGISVSAVSYSIGDLFALLLYVNMLRGAAKTAIDSYARIMASLGSVERVIALHDRGVMGERADAPEIDFKGKPTGKLMESNSSSSDSRSLQDDAETAGVELVETGGSRVWDDLALSDSRNRITGDVELCDVHFNYKSKAEVAVLRGASLKIAAGKVVLITGASGSGKSTLLQCANLLQRPFKGGIKFSFEDGRSDVVHELEHDFSVIRRLISSVTPTTSDVFNATVEDNIAAAVEHPVRASEIRNVCKRVGLHDYIINTKDGYRTRIGDGSGCALSSGQRAQLALARALLRRPMVLILDEASAHLDARAKQLFYGIIREECARGCSVLAVSHHREEFCEAVPSATVVALHNGKIARIQTPS